MRALQRSRRRPDTPIRLTCLGNAAPLRVSRPPGWCARSAILCLEELVAILVPPIEESCSRPSALNAIDLVKGCDHAAARFLLGADRRHGNGVGVVRGV